jgi:Protein of unknown function, DUF481
MSAPAAAQEQPAGAPTLDESDAVRVFLDCPACDEQYVRTEVTFVDYVRDRTAADVHVLITTQGTGGGGTRYTLQFIGLGRFKGIDHTLTYTAPQTATPDERRRGVTSILKLGLVRYVADTALASRLSLRFEGAKIAAATSTRDPWNFWVFRIGGNGGFDGEQSTSQRSVSMNFSANRTTADWKLNLNGSGNYRLQRFDLEEEGTLRAIRRSYDGRALVARSLTPHWSIGATGAMSASTFTNYDLRTRLSPAIEYNVFPYAESTRRILTMLYSVGFQTADYTEETIYGRFNEKLLDHQFELSMGLRQPWGTANASFETSHYLNRDGKFRVSAFGGADVRLFKGFSISIDGGISRRRDQLSLRRGEASTEDILIRQRELATDYSYDFGFGISYSFGSIFNSVVNPRFRSAGGF